MQHHSLAKNLCVSGKEIREQVNAIKNQRVRPRGGKRPELNLAVLFIGKGAADSEAADPE